METGSLIASLVSGILSPISEIFVAKYNKQQNIAGFEAQKSISKDNIAIANINADRDKNLSNNDLQKTGLMGFFNQTNSKDKNKRTIFIVFGSVIISLFGFIIFRIRK